MAQRFEGIGTSTDQDRAIDGLSSLHAGATIALDPPHPRTGEVVATVAGPVEAQYAITEAGTVLDEHGRVVYL